MTLMPRSVRTAVRRPPQRRNPYEKFRGRDLTLTDYLAIDRTILANERTSLAYARTALAMIIIGGTAVKFFTEWYMWVIGGVFLVGAVVVGVIGAQRYLRTSRYLAAALERQTGDPGHPLRQAEKSKAEGAKQEGAKQEGSKQEGAKEVGASGSGGAKQSQGKQEGDRPAIESKTPLGEVHDARGLGGLGGWGGRGERP